MRFAPLSPGWTDRLRLGLGRRRVKASAREPLPASPFLRAAPGGRGRRWRAAHLRGWAGITAAVIVLAAVATARRWFDPAGWFRPLYVVHDTVVLPAVGEVWTAVFPWGLLWLVPAAVAAVLAAVGWLSGRRPLAAPQRGVILAAARGRHGAHLITVVHRMQLRWGVPGRFMRMVVAGAAAAAVDAVVFAAPPGADEDALAGAWRLVAAAGAMTADTRDDARATFAAAAEIALLWLVAPPRDPATRLAVRTAWQRLWLPLAPPDDGGGHEETGGGPERVARFLRRELSAMEAAVRDLERPPDEPGWPPRPEGYPAHYPIHFWQHHAELLVAATFLAGLQPAHAALAMRVVDAVERIALADLLSGGEGTAAEAVAQALAVTRAREAASLIGARVDRAAAADLGSWRGAGLEPGDLRPALAGLAEAAADPRADAPPEAAR